MIESFCGRVKLSANEGRKESGRWKKRVEKRNCVVFCTNTAANVINLAYQLNSEFAYDLGTMEFYFEEKCK